MRVDSLNEEASTRSAVGPAGELGLHGEKQRRVELQQLREEVEEHLQLRAERARRPQVRTGGSANPPRAGAEIFEGPLPGREESERNRWNRWLRD